MAKHANRRRETARVKRGVLQRRIVGDEVRHVRVVVNTELLEEVADLIARAEGIKADLQEVLALVKGKRIGNLILRLGRQRATVQKVRHAEREADARGVVDAVSAEADARRKAGRTYRFASNGRSGIFKLEVTPVNEAQFVCDRRAPVRGPASECCVALHVVVTEAIRAAADVRGGLDAEG